MLRDDKNGKARADQRFGFACCNVTSADDYGSTTVRLERDGKHTNAQRVPRPAAKNRLVTGRVW
jgi:hypothetical protein